MINKELKSNTLVIPKGLHTHKKVEQLFNYSNDATILYKSFDHDLNNLEFYTQTYCIVYNCSGVETITSYDFTEVVIRENELLFLPKDMYLISDFVKTDKSLEAFLFFFNDDIIEKFLSIKKIKKDLVDKKVSFYKMEVNSSVIEYMNALKQVSKNQFDSKHFLELKLIELLCIIDSTDTKRKLVNSLLRRNSEVGYENVSHFIKAFKKKYSATPKQLAKNNLT